MTTTTRLQSRPLTIGGRHISPDAAVLALIVAGTVLRVINAGLIGLGVDESYVVTVSRSFSSSYFDHPPLHYWIIGVTTWLTGSEHPMVVRAPFIALFALTTWLMYRLTSLAFDPWAGVASALLLNLSAVFSLTTGGWVLPDGPLMASLLAASLALATILLRQGTDAPSRRQAIMMWAIAGFFGGLAMLSKYHGVFLFVGVLAFLVSHPPSRRWLAHPGPWAGAIIAAIIISPVIYWNYQHDFVSIAFQGGRGAPGDTVRPDRMLTNIAGQAAWVLPWIFIPLAWVFVRAVITGVRDRRTWFFVCLGAGPILVFTIVVMWGSRGLFHWQAPGWLFIFPILGAAVASRLRLPASSSTFRITRTWLATSAALFIILTAVLATHTATGWLRSALPGFDGKDPTVEALTWNELRTAMDEDGLLDDDGVFVIALHWLEGGKIGQALGPDIPVVCFCNDPRHFAFNADPRDFQGRNAIIVGRQATMDRGAESIVARFAEAGARRDITLTRGGHAEVAVAFIPANNLLDPYPLPYPQRD